MAPTGPMKVYNGVVTTYVITACIVAASGGALFGYDNGITGGVVSMPGFLQRFFPGVTQGDSDVSQSTDHPTNPFCQYNNQGLAWFTSSLFIAGAAAALPGAYITRHKGRKFTMLMAGLLFDVGVIFLAAAYHISMLIIGRVLLGFAVALASVAVTLYNSEMAPAQIRGRLNQIFQIVLTLGVFVAQAINIGTAHIYPWGWRVSLALAGMPAIVLTFGGIFLPDTPNSLIERGYKEQGRKVLQDIRGTQDVDEEFTDICNACVEANKVQNPWKTILSRKYRPQLVLAAASTFFQQWTGINTIIFYAPQLFVSLGVGEGAALGATIVTGIVNHLATYVSFHVADKYGRRILFIEGGIQMTTCLIIIAIVLAQTGVGNDDHVNEPWVAWFVLVFICIYIAAYAWSWGPLGWLYPSEIQPLETRSAGQGIATLVNLLFSFIIGQTYLSMLCAFKWGIFLFFGLFCVAGTLFVYFLFPETKGIPIEEVPNIFKRHWYWKRFVLDEPGSEGKSTGETEMTVSGRPLETPQWVDEKESASQGLVSIWEPKSDDLAAHGSEHGHTNGNGHLMNGLENSTSRSHLNSNVYQDVDLS